MTCLHLLLAGLHEGRTGNPNVDICYPWSKTEQMKIEYISFMLDGNRVD